MRVIDVVLEVRRIEDAPKVETVVVVGLERVAEAGAGTFRVVEEDEPVGVRDDHLMVLRSGTRYPFTAAAVKPLMKYRWKNANKQAIGTVATVEAAIAAPHIGAC